MVLECLQRKVDSQFGMIDAFLDLYLDEGKSYSTMSASFLLAKVALELAVHKLETMRVLKSAFSTQLEYMQASSQCPALESSPKHLDSYDAAKDTKCCHPVSLFFLW